MNNRQLGSSNPRPQGSLKVACPWHSAGTGAEQPALARRCTSLDHFLRGKKVVRHRVELLGCNRGNPQEELVWISTGSLDIAIDPQKNPRNGIVAEVASAVITQNEAWEAQWGL